MLALTQGHWPLPGARVPTAADSSRFHLDWTPNSEKMPPVSAEAGQLWQIELVGIRAAVHLNTVTITGSDRDVLYVTYHCVDLCREQAS